MRGIVEAIGTLAILLIDIVIFLKNFRAPSAECKHTFITLQLVFAFVGVITFHGIGYALGRLLVALVTFLFAGGLVKFCWGCSVAFSILSIVGTVMALVQGVV